MIDMEDGTKRFESIEKFIDHLKRGDEIEFIYQGSRYWIFPKLNGKLILSPPVGTGLDYAFTTISELLSFQLGDEKLENIILQAPVTHSLFN